MRANRGAFDLSEKHGLSQPQVSGNAFNDAVEHRIIHLAAQALLDGALHALFNGFHACGGGQGRQALQQMPRRSVLR